MQQRDPKNFIEELWKQIFNQKRPTNKRKFIGLLVFIFILVIAGFFGVFGQQINYHFFTKESEIIITVADNSGKDLISDYGDDQVYFTLNPHINGSRYKFKLWLQADGDTPIFTERIKFTLDPCYLYVPIENQQHRIDPGEAITLPLDFNFYWRCSWLDDLKSGEIAAWMANLCIDITYTSKGKAKEKLQCKNFPMNMNLLRKALNLTDDNS